jgi:hypothetical protein
VEWGRAVHFHLQPMTAFGFIEVDLEMERQAGGMQSEAAEQNLIGA